MQEDNRITDLDVLVYSLELIPAEITAYSQRTHKLTTGRNGSKYDEASYRLGIPTVLDWLQ